MARQIYRSPGPEEESLVSSCIKWTLFAFNLFFWVVSLVLIGVGVWAYIVTQEFNKMNGTGTSSKDVFDYLFDFALVFIVFGVLVFVLSLLGLVGSLRENICMLKSFAIILAIIFVVELAMTITLLVFASKANEVLDDILKDEAIRDYRDDINRQNVIDWVQETFECCGVGDERWRSWEVNRYFSCDSPGFEACSVPYSCCVKENLYKYDSEVAYTRCGHGMLAPGLTASDVSDKIFVRGCVDAVQKVAEDNVFIIGGLILFGVLLQLVGIALAWILARQVGDQRSLKRV